MRISKLISSLSAVMLLASANAGRAETTIELKGTHLCCPACVKAVGEILKGVDGVTGKCDTKAKTVTLTAKDDATVQKAIDALAAGGFHGDTGSKTVTIKEDSGVAKGKVKTLSVTDVHNCCGACTKSIKDAVKKVEGVTANTVKPRTTTFEVTGDFDAEAVIKALNAAGFHAKVK